ncbi:MAG: Trk system potassium transporter TrkA [Bacteroidia bacterium]
MRIIIAGAGEVGFHLARLLAMESQDIVLLDIDQHRLDYAESLIDVITIRGDATSYSVLHEAKVEGADLLIAVTESGDTNFTTSVIGKKLGAKKTVARIRNMEYLVDKEVLDLRTLGIDELISPESLAAREIKRLLREAAFTDSFDFANGKLSLIGIHLDSNAPVIGKSLIETAPLNPDLNFLTVAIHRNKETIIPHGRTVFEAGDHVYFISDTEGIDQVLHFSGKIRTAIKNVMILGGSRTGVHAARRLNKDYNIKLIEINKEKSFEIADKLPDVLVINGDGTNVELLEEEGISDVDAFVAVTGNSETNILSCLVAKNRGVKKTIAMVENIEYINLSQSIGIDTMINKKLIAANFIFRYIRRGEVIALTGIHGVDAELLEFKVKEHSRITKKPIRELKFPKSAIIGGVVRDGKGYITLGNFQIKPHDRVVVFTLSSSIYDVEEFFR